MGAPAGNQNARKRNRMLTSALVRELTQTPEDAVAIVKRLIQGAKDGESWAQALVWERTDGKVPQALVGDDSEDPISVREILIRAVDAASDRPPSES